MVEDAAFPSGARVVEQSLLRLTPGAPSHGSISASRAFKADRCRARGGSADPPVVPQRETISGERVATG